MKDLLIGSVYSTSDRNNYWYKLQTDFIKKNTTNVEYDFSIYFNCKEEEYEEEQIFEKNIIARGLNNYYLSENHKNGLNHIIKYAKENKYKNLLLLDSDCFPIKEKWFNELLWLTKDVHYAAPIRFENLDNFPHPCCFFIKNITDSNVFFLFQEITTLVGQKINECIPNIDNFYPLIRSNYNNLDPIMCGIYKDMFYHHACGSRVGKSSRSNDLNYYGMLNSLNRINKHENILYEKLISDPEEFISSLMRNNQNKEMLI